MRTKSGSVRELIAGIRQAAEQEEYNPAEDLKLFKRSINGWAKRTSALCWMQWSKIRCRGICSHPCCIGRKARNGDIEAIKMYREMQSSGGSDEVVIVDDVE